MNDEPLVSICIPTFNGERFIRATLDSVMSQTYQNLEIRISDQLSTDRTLEIISEYKDSRISLNVERSGGGAEKNWNSAISGASGKYLKLLCQDDILNPSCISKQVEGIERFPGSSFCFSSRDIISPKGRTLLPSRGFKPPQAVIEIEEYLPALVRSGTNIFGEPCSVLISTNALKKAGPFHGTYLIDLNMWYSLWNLAPAVYVPTTAAKFRISSGSWTTRLIGTQAKLISETLHAYQRDWPDLVTFDDIQLGIIQATRLEKNRARLTRLVEFLGI